MPRVMGRPRMLYLYNGLLDVSIVSQPKLWQAMEGMYLLLRDKILNHRNVMPYRTQELSGQIAEHTPVSVDGRLLEWYACWYVYDWC